MLISNAYAQAAAGASPQGFFEQFWIFPLMIAVMYFMIIRPQQRRAKEQAALVAAIKSGDEVLTSSGIYGTVTNVNPEKKTVTVRIADNVKVVMSREAVTTVLNKPETAVASSTVAAKPVR